MASRAGGRVGIIDVWIQLDGDPVLVADRADGPQSGLEVDGAFAGNQMMVNARGGNVFQMEMANVRAEAGHGRGRVVANAIEMTDVKIQAHRGRVDVPHQFHEL